MLAKELKIQNLKRQREFIKGQLSVPREDGTPHYLYKGYIYPENLKYFENEGYVIHTFYGSDDFNSEPANIARLLFQFFCVYVFVPNDSDMLVLNEKELKQAEAVNLEEDY